MLYFEGDNVKCGSLWQAVARQYKGVAGCGRLWQGSIKVWQAVACCGKGMDVPKECTNFS
jgi:hypothetical protein